MPAAPKVLIVDDEAHVRTYFKLLVRGSLHGAEVTEAAGHPEAIAQFARGLPDLVLLDLNLVGESGLRVLRDLRALDEALPVVILTSVNVRHTVEEALAAGATNYVLKDTPPAEIAALLQEVLNRPTTSEGSSDAQP